MTHYLLFITILYFFTIHIHSIASESELFLGVKLQKTHSLYYENGFNAEYSSSEFLANQFHSGFSYISSRFGSAFNSNAIKQDIILFHTSYTFLEKAILNPFIKLNAGLIIADYQSPLFDDIDNTMPLTSIDLGLSYTPIKPLKAQVSLGYNIITSDGTSGVGTVYPLYFNIIIMWNIFK
jgi:hypothetical protein